MLGKLLANDFDDVVEYFEENVRKDKDILLQIRLNLKHVLDTSRYSTTW